MHSRRAFCTATAGAVGGSLLVGRTRAQSETVTVSGTVQSAVGASLADSHVVLVHQETYEWYRAGIGSDGSFSASVPTGAEYYLVFFDQEQGDLLNPEFNGVPAIADLDEFRVDSETDLGSYTVPEAHVVTIRIQNPEGNPLQNVPLSFRVPSGNGTGPGAHTTDENGYVSHVQNDRPGIELAGSVTVETHRPDGSGETLDALFVDENIEVTTVLRNQDEYSSIVEREATEGTATPEIVEQTDEPDRVTAESDGSADEPDRSADDPNSGDPVSAESGGEATGPSADRRGFLSNGGDEPEALSNPMNLTVGGFVLSVVGILSQLLGGS